MSVDGKRRFLSPVIGVASTAALMTCLVGSTASAAPARTDTQRGAAAASRVIPIAIVRVTIPGRSDLDPAVHTEPRQVEAKNGDVLRFCNRTDVIVSLFSISRYNRFGEPKGLRVVSGACSNVTLHNPTQIKIKVAIFSEVQLYVRVYANVSPGATPASPVTWSGTWRRSEVPGTMTLAQSGSTVTGSWTWNDGTGKVTGTTKDGRFTGKFTESCCAGTFDLHLSGKRFGGSYTCTRGCNGSGGFNGTCIAGGCLKNR